MNQSKIIQDAVHGMIDLEPLATLIIDTPEFQRLRSIHQLGLAYLVFPSCQHTRFEHSIGTYHLARRLTEAIQNDPVYNGPKLTKAESLAVRIAALCHDLGHGPFSHTWEHFLKEGGPKFAEYKHELLSCRILRHIVRTNPSIRESIEKAGVDVNLVDSLILGRPDTKSNATKAFLYEILSNNANGMDVDKWDYLLRDCLHAGLGQGNLAVDLDRFLHFYRPAPHVTANSSEEQEWHLAFRDTELESVLRTFALRQHLHQILYQHKTSTGIASMVCDLLELIDPVLNLREISLRALQSEDPSDLEMFVQLHDSLLWDIYHGRLATAAKFSDASRSELLSKARELASRIFRRKLYTYIDSVFEVHSENCSSSSNGQSNQWATPCGIREPFLSETLLPGSRIVGHLGFTTPGQAETAIRDQIFACLPNGSLVKHVDQLLVAKSSFSSNSTLHAPRFYFYTRTGKTFIYEEPLRVVHAYRLYWRGPFSSSETPESDRTAVLEQLMAACETWYRGKVQSGQLQPI